MNANNIDNTIDRALSVLRDAAPRPGLEGRILTSLEHRAATPQSTRFHISTQIALWTAASAAVIAIASLLVLHHRTAQPRVPQVSTLRPGFGSPRIPVQRTTSIARHPERSAIAQSRRTPVSTDTETSRTDGVTPTDTQLFADLHAPSHPAPPLPLTPQEKLFLSRLRYGNATELAELDPIVRATHDDADTAAFKAFFPDPPPLQQPGDPDDSN